jgi:hypothetical protein
MILSLLMALFSSGQTEPGTIKLYDSWFDLNSSNRRLGNLYTYEFSDSTVTVVAINRYTTGVMPEIADLHIYPVNDINAMLFRKKGRKPKGFLCGLLIGGALGAGIGFAIGDTYWYFGESAYLSSAGFKAFFWGLVGGGIGIAIGGSAGSAKKKFIIKGDFGRYQEYKPEMIKYSIRNYAQ